MDWKNWKSWGLVGIALVALFAIYAFASPRETLRAEPSARPAPVRRTERRPSVPVMTSLPGLDLVQIEELQPSEASYMSRRNLFSFVEPPPPPPPPAPKAVVPEDRDKDGVPDYMDNCPGVANPTQTDIDRNGVGSACQEGIEQPPPPPKPQPPAFPYKYLGTFGPSTRPLAVFSSGDQILNVRVGQTFGGKFILVSIGIESVDIRFTGFPPDETRRIAVGQ